MRLRVFTLFQSIKLSLLLGITVCSYAVHSAPFDEKKLEHTLHFIASGIGFFEDEIEYMMNSNEPTKQQIIASWSSMLMKLLVYHDQLKNNYKHRDLLLNEFLKRRFLELAARKKTAEECMLYSTGMASHFIHSLPFFTKNYPDKHWAKLASVCLTAEYQILNRIIKDLFQLDLEGLSEETVRLLGASISIHPYLKGETSFSGYQDEAWDFLWRIHGTQRNPKDIEIFNDNFIYDLATKKCEAISLDQEREVIVPNLNLGARNSFFKIIMEQRKAMELGMILEIPTLQWTHVKKASVHLEVPSSSQDPLPETPVIEAESKEFLENSLSAGSAKVEATNSPPSQSLVRKEDKKSLKERKSEQSIIKALARKKNQDLDPAASSEILSPLQARGRRMFYSARPEPLAHERLLTKLQANDKIWLASLFKKLLNEVSYREFSRVWNRINGPGSIDISDGSSHGSLLNSKGEIVADIFTHGNNQKYGKKYQNYLRDAFIAIGINPEQL